MSKYIKQLIIKNFQKHKNLNLHFDSKLNIITGISDAGKTSILRAIKWLINNKPTGDRFITHGQKETEVKALFNDGTWISHYKNRSGKNRIKIGKDNKSKIFDNFGVAVPAQVLKFVGCFELPQYDMVFMNQRSQRFLIEMSEEQRGNWFAELIGIGEASTIRTSLRSDIKGLQTNRGILLDECEVIDKKVNEDYYKKLDVIWAEIALKKDKLNKLLDRVQILKKIYHSLEAHNNNKLDLTQKLYGLVNRLNKINELNCNLINDKSRFELCSSTIKLINKRKNAQDKFNRLSEQVYSTNDIDNCIKNVKVLQNLSMSKFAISAASEENKKQFDIIDNKLLVCIDFLEKLKQEIKVCPTCNRAF